MNCPYCKSTKVTKKGTRAKKYETVQLYYCQHCQRKFNPLVTKGKTYPLKVILDALSHYNRFLTQEEAAKKVNEKYGLSVSFQNISNWMADFSEYITFSRMRDFIAKKYDRREILVESQLFHGQIYDFKYHRAKTDCLIDDDFKNYKFRPLQEFLELVVAECPHSVFKDSERRASEYKGIFNFDGVKFIPRNNQAVKNTRLVLQAVDNNKLRHQVLQEFMLLNDSVTVATEVPVLLDEDDLRHYRDELGFQIPKELNDQFSMINDQSIINNQPHNNQLDHLNIDHSLGVERLKNENFVITGHIDLLQIRNGAIHIMDYKPSARKEKPLDQLTLYALALSRLTGLRLFNFKCAWFDEEDYFEFFPLHVVYKKKRRKAAKQRRKSDE